MAKTVMTREIVVSEESVRQAVFRFMDECHEENRSLGYEIVVRGPGFEGIRARSIYWTALANLAECEAIDADYSVEIVEAGDE